MIESRGRGVLDAPPEPVIGLAAGEARWRGMTGERSANLHLISGNYARSIDPDITGTQRPPMNVAVTTPSFFSAFACKRLGRPISTP